MQPTILSQLDLRRFNSQISDKTVGIEGQEKLRYSQVAILGLNGIGIAAMSCLLATGVGQVIVIDDGIITENMLPSQTLFGSEDVGKLRCIAAHEKQKRGTLDSNSLRFYNTKLKKENIDRLLGESEIVIKPSWGPEFNYEVLDLVDEKNLYLVGGFGVGWKGVYGAYSNLKKKEFRDLYTNLYLSNKNIFTDHICFSFVANLIGSVLASMTIKKILNLHKTDTSNFHQVDMLDTQFLKLL